MSNISAEGTSLSRSYAIGSPLTVTWSMPYAHQGGYTLRLLNEDGDIVQFLAGQNDAAGVSQWTGLDDLTCVCCSVNYGLDVIFRRQFVNVTLPTDECKNCKLQLRRQAAEWGSSYIFHSCADIDLINPVAGAFSLL